MTRTLLPLASMLVAASAAAQAPAGTAPPPEAPERAAKDRPRLKLKLDDPASFARITSEKPAKDLPSLGPEARPTEQPSKSLSDTPAFPKDSNPGL